MNSGGNMNRPGMNMNSGGNMNRPANRNM